MSGTACAAVLVLVGSVAFVIHMDALRVARVEVHGALPGQDTRLEHEAWSRIRGTYLWVIPRDSIFLVRGTSVAAALVLADPRLRTVEADLERMRVLRVNVLNRKPEAKWCGEAVPPAAYGTTLSDTTATSAPVRWGHCYIMDETSYIYENDTEPPLDLPRYYGPLEHAEPIGQAFIESTEYAATARLRAELARAGYVTTAMLLVDETQSELYLENGTRVLIRRGAAAEEVLRELSAATGAEALRDTRDIEYLDLRWKGKAYYRYRDGS